MTRFFLPRLQFLTYLRINSYFQFNMDNQNFDIIAYFVLLSNMPQYNSISYCTCSISFDF